MTGAVLTGTPANARTRRYLDAERRLWDRYGLDPTDRFMSVGSSGP